VDLCKTIFWFSSLDVCILLRALPPFSNGTGLVFSLMQGSFSCLLIRQRNSFPRNEKASCTAVFPHPIAYKPVALARTPVLHVSVLQDHYRPKSPSFLMSCFHHPTLSDLRRTRFESEGSPWNILSPTMWLPMMDRLIWLQLCHLIAMAAPPALYQEVSHPTPLIQPSQES